MIATPPGRKASKCASTASLVVRRSKCSTSPTLNTIAIRNSVGSVGKSLPRSSFDNNAAERGIRMAKIRQKISGCVRTMTGAEHFCAIRSYLATAARHGITWLDALTRAAEGNPWIPGTT